MKRTGFIRRRSKTNSRKLKDPVLVDQYRDGNPGCEFHQFPGIPGGRHGEEINHIFSCRRRPDLLSNLIHLSAAAHRWFHEYPIDGRIMSLYVKWKKSELDDAEIKQASGMHIAGYLSSKPATLAWVEPYRIELMGAFP